MAARGEPQASGDQNSTAARDRANMGGLYT